MPGINKIQYQIFVKGNVQRVGFRDKVEDLADELGLSGYVENCPKKDVFILVEGEESLLVKFKEEILSFPQPIKVKSIEVTEHPFEGAYEDFTIIRGDTDQELAERFDVAIGYLHRSDFKQDLMLNKQDQMVALQERSLGKLDTVISMQYETLTEVKGLRSDFQKRFSDELVEVRSEIREFRSAMMEAGYIKKADVK